MSASISISLAMTMASSFKTSPGIPSTRTPSHRINRSDSTRPKEISIYKGISNRPLGWKPRRSTMNSPSSPLARDIIRMWDGTGRKSAVWDGLRRDPELWLPNGDCLVHLYGYGQSQRGPAFRLFLSDIRAANCEPLLDRFMVNGAEYSPSPETTSSFDVDCSGRRPAKQHELYIPAPAQLERSQAFLYHTATRNFFAWIFGKSLVGNHLGGALVALLNSMNEFRDMGEDNIQSIMTYMAEEGYGDMRDQPDHALGILFFAEHFKFRDLWIDAFAHCTGMNEQLGASPGYEFISQSSRSIITRSRIEMDIRLESCGKRLETFLSDDLSEAGLSAGARAHLDKFRSFLQSYFVGRLGYYPPTSGAQKSTFPKSVYSQMCSEFERLYEFLMDEQFTTSNPLPPKHSDGISVENIVENFNKHHQYESLLHPLPLLPDTIEPIKPKLSRFGFQLKPDKTKPNPRLLTSESLSKATNPKGHILRCSLVRAYRGFEKEFVFSSSPLFVDKDEKLSQKEARKVRWILIYAILQTLLSATRIPNQVTDVHNVPYNLCVLTADCPPWKDEQPYEAVGSTQTEQGKETSASTGVEEKAMSLSTPQVKNDIEKFSLFPKPQQTKVPNQPSSKPQGSVKKARGALEDAQRFRHTRSSKGSYHEILIQGYGNGTSIVNMIPGSASTPQKQSSHSRSTSSESGSSSIEDSSFRWSNSSLVDTCSPSTSVGGESRRSSKVITEASKDEFTYLDGDSGFFDLERVPDSLWVEAVDESCAWEPELLDLKKLSKGKKLMQITTEVKVEWNELKENGDLFEYLHDPDPCPMVMITA